MRRELAAREAQLKIIRKAEHVAERQRRASTKRAAATAASADTTSLPALPGASAASSLSAAASASPRAAAEVEDGGRNEDISAQRAGEATDGSFHEIPNDGSLERGMPKPSLIPFVLEVLQAQPDELSVQSEGIFLLMHMAEEVSAIKVGVC